MSALEAIRNLEFLRWPVLALGVLNILYATLLFPLIRRFNVWLLGWYGRVAGRLGPPQEEPLRRLAEWWVSREGLQRACALAIGLALLALWWFAWGARLAS
jgi:hypothetical protein